MSGMFWIALELSIPKIGFNIMLSLSVKKLDAFKFDGVAESDNTDEKRGKTTRQMGASLISLWVFVFNRPIPHRSGDLIPNIQCYVI